MQFTKSIFNECPRLLEIEGPTAIVNFDIAAVEITTETASASSAKGAKPEVETRVAYEAYSVRIAQPIDYDTIVSAIVSAAYPSDKMQAIINNHLLESDNPEHEQEFSDMQSWRSHAKEVARQAVAYYLQ